ncbi:MAG: hypothetical protein ABI954_10190 [Pyrinomonadaceae bacterium]
MEAINYRETLTRENLEQIKPDQGAGSFVLETKQGRVSCFMGMVSEMQIEISAAPSPAALATESADKEKTKKALPSSRFDLTDNALTSPRALEHRHADLMTNTSTRSAASQYLSNNFADNLENEIPPVPKILQNEIPSESINLKANARAEDLQTHLPLATREFELRSNQLRHETRFATGDFAVRQQSVQSISIETNINISGELSQSPFYEAYNELMAFGVSSEIAGRLVSATISQYKSRAIKANQIAKIALQGIFPSLVKFAEDPLVNSNSAILALIGTTGVGKTTTVAKLAARLALRESRRVELVTLDTYRIAAVEQLKAYAEIIGAGCHVVRTVGELDATLRAMPAETSVLIDTTGKNPHDLADQFELSEYLQQRSDIRKCLTLQATINPQDAISAVRKFEMYGADCLALTKIDETTRPGAVIEIIAKSALPLVYLCTGQRVPEDLKAATLENFTARILNSRNSFGAGN